MIIIYSFMILLLFSNVVFYRFNSDFITLPVLTQTSNFGSLGSSIMDLVYWTDIFYLVDIILLVVLFRASRQIWSSARIKLRQPIIIIASGLLLFTINLGLAEIEDRKSTRLNSSHVA